MKLYRDYKFASMSFGNDPRLIPALDFASERMDLDTIIETGTFLGTGSTKILADYFLERRTPKCFVSMEVNWLHWKQAKENVRHYGFVDCRWAASIDREQAINFIRCDPLLNNHNAYPNIFIDDIDDPVRFYSQEIMGSMAGQGKLPVGGDSEHDFCWEGDDFLKRMLQIHRLHKPLVVLDSAGGIGFLEFQNTIDTMGEEPYALLIDDTHHIKHHRSLEHIKNSAEFEIVATSPESGWALALHR